MIQHVLQLVKKKNPVKTTVSALNVWSVMHGYLADAKVSQLRYLHSMLLKEAIISDWASFFLHPPPSTLSTWRRPSGLWRC